MAFHSQKRKNTLDYHSDLYKKHQHFQKGSWLEKPEKRIIDIIKTYFLNNHNVRILDFGSGVGRHAIPIAQMIGKNGGYIDSVDILPIAITKLHEYAKKFNVEQYIHGVVSGIEEYIILPRTYDCIISHSVLTHCSTKELFIHTLKQICDGIKPNGIVYLCFATNQKIIDLVNNTLLDNEEEIEITDKEGLLYVHTIFSGWKIIEEIVEPYTEIVRAGDVNKQWNVDYLVFVAQKYAK